MARSSRYAFKHHESSSFFAVSYRVLPNFQLHKFIYIWWFTWDRVITHSPLHLFFTQSQNSMSLIMVTGHMYVPPKYLLLNQI